MTKRTLADFFTIRKPSSKLNTIIHNPVEIGYGDIISLKVTLIDTNMNTKDTVIELYKQLVDQFFSIKKRNAEYIISTEVNMHIETFGDNSDTANPDYTLKNNTKAHPHVLQTDSKKLVLEMIKFTQLDLFDVDNIIMSNETSHYEIHIEKINHVIIQAKRVNPEYGARLYILEDLDIPKYMKKGLTIPYNIDQYCLLHAIYMTREQKRLIKDELEYLLTDENSIIKSLFNKQKGFLFNKKNMEILQDHFEIYISMYEIDNESNKPVCKYRPTFIDEEREHYRILFCNYKTDDADNDYLKSIDYIPGHFARVENEKIFFQNIKDVQNNNQSRIVYCKYCDCNFQSKDKLFIHQDICFKAFNFSSNKLVTFKAPKETKLFMKDTSCRIKRDLFVAFDFETVSNIDGKHRPYSYGMYLWTSDKVSHMIQEHNRYKMFSHKDPEVVMTQFYKDCSYYLAVAKKILQTKRNYDPSVKYEYVPGKLCYFCGKPALENEELQFDHCHIDGHPRAHKDDKVYTSWCHTDCNQRAGSISREVIFLAHNLTGFDSNLLLKYQHCSEKQLSFSVLGSTSIKFKTFDFTQLDNTKVIIDKKTQKEKLVKTYSIKAKFIDSFAFNSTSLQKWLVATPSNIFRKYMTNVIKLQYKGISQEDIDWIISIISKKSIFPYTTFCEEMNNRNNFPSQEEFDTDLSGPCKTEDYQEALKVYNRISRICGNTLFKNYHDLYLMSDVLGLACCFSNYSNTFYECYGIEPLSAIGLPSTAKKLIQFQNRPREIPIKLGNNNPLYNYTKICKGLAINSIPDVTIYLDIVKNIAAGVCFAGKRISISKNNIPRACDIIHPDLWQKYNIKQQKSVCNEEKLERKCIFGMDVINLYSSGHLRKNMKLPVSYEKTIQWSSDSEAMFFLDNIPDLENHDYYYIFKADIHIPLELHDTFRQYPIAASNRLVNIEELSSSQQETMKNSTISSKLVADLIDKKQFMLGITQYKLYKKLGLQFSNFSECYVFNSDNVYTHIIATNTADRSIAKGNIKALKTMEQTPEIKDKIIAEESISTIKKLTNNICYGLSLCSNVKYRNFELINDLKTLRRRINNPLTRDFRIITSSTETGDAEKFLIGCMKQYQTITCDSAVHIGFALLEYSKVIMAERIHCQLFPYLRENKCTFETCTTDTDSIYIEIDFTNSPWENEWQLKKSIAQEIKDFSDTSVYSKESIFYNNFNEGCVGLFTDEFAIEDIENLKVPKCMTVMGPKSYAVLYEHYKLIDGEYVSTGLISEKLARKGVKKSDETEQAIAIEDKQKMSDYILGKENTKLIGVDTYHKKEVLNFFHYFALQSGLLLNQDTIEVSQPRLKNNNMIIENFVENKIGLSTRDSKVYLCENGIDFLPFGHYSIKK